MDMQKRVGGTAEICNWRKRVNSLMKKNYSLTIELSGFSEEQIEDYYRPDLPPEEFETMVEKENTVSRPSMQL